jgi:hypothetical protein
MNVTSPPLRNTAEIMRVSATIHWTYQHFRALHFLGEANDLGPAAIAARAHVRFRGGLGGGQRRIFGPAHPELDDAFVDTRIHVQSFP